jgi:hypothetical protein
VKAVSASIGNICAPQRAVPVGITWVGKFLPAMKPVPTTEGINPCRVQLPISINIK